MIMSSYLPVYMMSSIASAIWLRYTFFNCESFPAKQAEDIKRVKRSNIGGGWNIYFS